MSEPTIKRADETKIGDTISWGYSGKCEIVSWLINAVGDVEMIVKDPNAKYERTLTFTPHTRLTMW